MPRAMTLVDQVLSSVSNVLAVVLVARVLDKAEFGRFALGYTMLTLTLNLSRAYFGTRVSLEPEIDAARRLTGRLMGSLVLLSPAVVVVVFLGSWAATGGQSTLMLLIVACATPLVCIQDIVRFGAASTGHAWAALASDGVWVLVMVVPFVAGWRLSPTSALALWAGAAVLALVVALLAFGQPASLAEGLVELRTRDRIGESATVSSVLANVGSFWVLLIASRAIDDVAAGSLRGAATSIGPINVILAFSAVSLTPTLVRRPRAGDIRFCATAALGMAGMTAMWGLFLLVLPAEIGRSAFGDSWRGIRGVLPWTVSEYVFLCLAAGSVIGLKVRGCARALVNQRIASVVVSVVGGTAVAVVTQQAWVVSATLAFAALVSASVSWGQLLRSGHVERIEPVLPTMSVKSA